MLRFARHHSVVSTFSSIPEKSTIFSLIQPTGRIHLGNYLGAIRSWEQLSNTAPEDSRLVFGVADLHAITIPYDAKELYNFRYDAIASLLACGVNPEKCILYHQSAVREHMELSWYLTCVTSMGGLHRMTQWKLKSQQHGNSESNIEKFFENTKAGLLYYPVLQAADILLYKSTHVPVGDDQAQHLELCRGIASSFNHVHKTKFFPQPKTLLTASKKVNSLRNPTKKMSKSDPDQSSCIYITDTPEAIRKKIRKLVTDSEQGPLTFDPENRPGIANLISIVAGLTDQTPEAAFDNVKHLPDHKLLKDYVTDVVVETLAEKRENYERLVADQEYLHQICQRGNDRAREIAVKNIREVRTIMGLN